MGWLAFPLRVDQTGRLARIASRQQALGNLLQILFVTRALSWERSPDPKRDFDWRTALAAMKDNHNVRKEVLARFNRMLRELGVDDVELLQITPAQSSSAGQLGEVEYEFKLKTPDGEEVVRKRV